MKNQKLVLLAVALLFLYLLNFRLTNTNEHWTVYGTNNCGWTRKQVDYMKTNRIPHTYIECDKHDCGEITSYPTLQNSSGKKLVGFNRI